MRRQYFRRRGARPPQGQARRQVSNQSRQGVFAGVLLQLHRQPLPVLVQEAIARDQAGAQRQGQARATLVHAQLDALGARVAHALDVDRSEAFDFQRYLVPLNGVRRRQAKTAQEHASIMTHAKQKPSVNEGLGVDSEFASLQLLEAYL